ncbi:MAG: hypothetical protein LKE54_01910 [Prevotella sp.]|nr:hypothetical protein [Prevotella sp.]MCH3993811.1 hypothetical protein [Prevotella sp.]
MRDDAWDFGFQGCLHGGCCHFGRSPDQWVGGGLTDCRFAAIGILHESSLNCFGIKELVNLKNKVHFYDDE